MSYDLIFDYFEENVYFVLSFISFFAQIGVPLGAMFFIMYSGSVSSGFGQVFVLVFFVFVFMIIGDIVAYKIGEKYGTKILFKYNKYKIISGSHKASSNLMNKYGSLSVFFTRFLITGLGPAINYLAGLEKFNFRLFLIFIFFGELIYAFMFVYLGFIFKETFEELLSIISDFSTLIMLALVVYFVIKRIVVHIRFTD